MNCPSCSQPLQAVKAASPLGKALSLDQCPSCGGVWFDRWELYQTDDREVDRLDPVNVDMLRLPTALADAPLLCPRCAARLFTFVDPLLPPDAHILRCPSCQGLWLNRGEFRRFKESRKEKLSSAQKPLPPEAIAILGKNMGSKEAWQKVAQWGAGLSSDASRGAVLSKDTMELGDVLSTAVNILLSLLL